MTKFIVREKFDSNREHIDIYVGNVDIFTIPIEFLTTNDLSYGLN